MKKYLTLALLLLTVGSFAQTIDTTTSTSTRNLVLEDISVGTPLWEPTPSIIFTTASFKTFSLSWGNDTLKFESDIPVEEAAERFFNYLIRYNSHVIDSLKHEIEWRDEFLTILIREIPLIRLAEIISDQLKK